MIFLFNLSLILEFAALILSFYFKNTKIFFLVLAFLLAKLSYFYASIYQANIFIFSFLPLIFMIFAFKKSANLIFCKESLIFIFWLLIYQILAFFLAKNTNFISEISSFSFLNFTPLSSLGFVFFVIFTIFLFIKALKIFNFYLFFAFFFAFFPFLFESFEGEKFCEFASLVFIIFLLNQAYKSLYIDDLTKFKNQNALQRFLKGKENYFISMLHFSEFENTKKEYVKLILKQLAKKIAKFKARKFIVENDFVFIFDDEKTANEHLAFLESVLRNYELSLENERFKVEFKLVLSAGENDLNKDLKSLKEKLN